MIISLDTNNQHLNTITAYQSGEIQVNAKSYKHSIIVSPHTLISPWQPTTLAELTTRDFAEILQLKPKILLLGVGAQCQFPTDDILAEVYNAGIAIESMDTGAACRTYNVLLAEEREVVAALLIR